MGTFSDSVRCWKCGGKMYTAFESKQDIFTHIPYTSGKCLSCGFSFYIKEYQTSFEEINEIRDMYEMEILEKFKERKEGEK
tara:strand:- start:3683 stop:3925 length:243 start_codon:yes stop_codon:yes gene_type:complete